MTKLAFLRSKINELTDKYDSGMSTTMLGYEYDCNSGLIYLVLKEFGVELKKKQKFEGRVDDYEEKIHMMYNQGMTCKEIAKELNISPPVINNFFKRNKLVSNYDIAKDQTIQKLQSLEEQIATAYQMGTSIAQMMKNFKLSRPRIESVLEKFKIEIRKGKTKPKSPDGFKRCSMCKEEKKLEEFRKSKANKDGYSYQCKICKDKHYQQNKEHYLEYKSQHYNDNKEHLIKLSKQWRENNKEKCEINRKNYELNNKEEIRERRKQYYDRNAETIRQKVRDYAKTEPGKISKRVNENKRRELKQRLDSTYTKEQYQETLERFQNKCFKCGKEEVTLDHHYGLSNNCPLRPDTAVILCRSCNASKNDRHPAEFYSTEEIVTLSNLGIYTLPTGEFPDFCYE